MVLSRVTYTKLVSLSWESRVLRHVWPFALALVLGAILGAGGTWLLGMRPALGAEPSSPDASTMLSPTPRQQEAAWQTLMQSSLDLPTAIDAYERNLLSLVASEQARNGQLTANVASLENNVASLTLDNELLRSSQQRSDEALGTSEQSRQRSAALLSISIERITAVETDLVAARSAARGVLVENAWLRVGCVAAGALAVA